MSMTSLETIRARAEEARKKRDRAYARRKGLRDATVHVYVEAAEDIREFMRLAKDESGLDWNSWAEAIGMSREGLRAHCLGRVAGAAMWLTAIRCAGYDIVIRRADSGR